jgi:hypothetical protein
VASTDAAEVHHEPGDFVRSVLRTGLKHESKFGGTRYVPADENTADTNAI